MSIITKSNLRKDIALRELASSTPLNLRIQGNCMSPLLNDGATVKISSKRRYWPGDILVFRSRNDQICVHRFLACYPRKGSIYYLMKADQALLPDSPVKRTCIIGKVTGGDVSQKVSNVPLSIRIYAVCIFFRFALRRLTGSRSANDLR